MVFLRYHTLKRLLLSFLCAASTIATTVPLRAETSNAVIAAQINILMNDQESKAVIQQIHKIHLALEQDFLKNVNADQITAHVKTCLTSFCSFNQLYTLSKATTPITKMLIALCIASERFVEDAGKEYEKHIPESKGVLSKIQTGISNIKGKLWQSVAQHMQQSHNNNVDHRAYAHKINTLLPIVIAESATFTSYLPLLAINSIPVTLHDVNKHAGTHTDRFRTHLQKAIEETMTLQDLSTLLEFLQSPAYGAVKANSDKILATILASLPQKPLAAIVKSWEALVKPLNNLIDKAKAALNNSAQ